MHFVPFQSLSAIPPGLPAGDHSAAGGVGHLSPEHGSPVSEARQDPGPHCGPDRTIEPVAAPERQPGGGLRQTLLQGGALAVPPLGHPARLPVMARIDPAVRAVCRLVRQLIGEAVMLMGDGIVMRRDRRRLACHVRQMSMYVCHVALQFPMTDIGLAFGRDRTTVSHACHIVEDRRDDPFFDEFVSAMERMATAVFHATEIGLHD